MKVNFQSHPYVHAETDQSGLDQKLSLAVCTVSFYDLLECRSHREPRKCQRAESRGRF